MFWPQRCGISRVVVVDSCNILFAGTYSGDAETPETQSSALII